MLLRKQFRVPAVEQGAGLLEFRPGPVVFHWPAELGPGFVAGVQAPFVDVAVLAAVGVLDLPEIWSSGRNVRTRLSPFPALRKGLSLPGFSAVRAMRTRRAKRASFRSMAVSISAVSHSPSRTQVRWVMWRLAMTHRWPGETWWEPAVV